MKNMITDPKTATKLSKWKKKFTEAKNQYSEELERMKENEKLYAGDHYVNRSRSKGGGKSAKQSENVRNIVYELIETQVDSSIPMPKVTPIHEEDEELAKYIEMALENEIRLLHFNVLNDKSERTVPIQGGDFLHVEWDNTKGFHCNIGGLSVSERHPRNIIPQPGITEIEDMDYLFVMVPMTKETVKRRYNVDVSQASDTEIDLKSATNRDENADIVTVIKTYYRNAEGGIGLFTWCEEFVLEDYEDYQSRHLERCVSCGRVKTGDVCECGSKKFKKTAEHEEELTEDIVLADGTLIRASQKIPYYKPDVFPLVLRRNVSRDSKLLGFSDAEVIEDQQDAVKKIGSKIQEKILKGGSIVTLPQGMKITTDDRELKIVRISNPSQKAMIDVLNMQADTTIDRIIMESNYDWAKSTLGITDAYQGKYDSSATSGTAKQYSINQAAGRLESKRVMKNTAFAKLYELMFKHLLAYADQPIPLSKRNEKGEYEYAHFNRYAFLKQDIAGELYWDDEFIFETDPTSTIMMNRESMWNQIDVKYQAGAFGPIGEDRSLLTLWTFLEKNDYPGSSEMKEIFAKRVMEAEQQMGGEQNVVPQMQS